MNIIPIGSGKCSSFGGPSDTGVGAQEVLSCIDAPDLREWWFRRLFLSPGLYDNGKNLARNLDPNSLYCAMRWGYGSFAGLRGEILQDYSREQIRRMILIISFNGKYLFAQPSDWGPNTNTGRLIDLSPGCCKALGCTTGDIVSVQAIVS